MIGQVPLFVRDDLCLFRGLPRSGISCQTSNATHVTRISQLGGSVPHNTPLVTCPSVRAELLLGYGATSKRATPTDHIVAAGPHLGVSVCCLSELNKVN